MIEDDIEELQGKMNALMEYLGIEYETDPDTYYRRMMKKPKKPEEMEIYENHT